MVPLGAGRSVPLRFTPRPPGPYATLHGPRYVGGYTATPHAVTLRLRILL